MTMRYKYATHFQVGARAFSGNLPVVTESKLNKLSLCVYQKVLEIFSPQRRISASSISKLKKIILDVLRYIRRKCVGGVVALPKEVFIRATAHAGSMRTVFNYKTIRSAFEKLGLIRSLEVRTYRGGPCQHYLVSIGEDDVKIKKEDEFVGKKSSRSAVSSHDKYAIDILGDEVIVSGPQVIHFATAFESKLREYEANPYLTLLRGGSLLKGSKLSFYVRGAAICFKYNYDVRRFLESQFFFFHQWKGESPDIRYATSVYSMWNAMGRYEAYCERFKNELDYFGVGKDNIELMKRSIPRKESPAFGIRAATLISQQDYERIKDAFGLSDRELFFQYGHPLKPMLSLHFLMENSVWLTLLQEKVWGDEVDTGFWKFIGKIDIDKVR